MLNQISLHKIVAACFIFVAVSSGIYAQDAQKLIFAVSVERTIKGGESHFFTVNVGANQTARIEIEHKIADLTLVAFKPSGEKFIETDSPAGFSGNDWILVTADAAGEFKIAVAPKEDDADVGRYIIKLAEMRSTVAEDFQINEAAMKIQKLAERAETLRSKGTREERRQAADAYAEIINLSAIKKDKVWETVATVEQGDIFRQLGEYQKSIELTERGLTLAREIKNHEHEGSALNNLGVIYKELGDYEKGILYLTQALYIQRETNDKGGEAIVLNNLGSNYLMSGDLVKAAELYQQSIVLRRLVKDRRGEGNVLNNLGQVFARGDNHAEAVKYLEQALAIRRELGDKYGEAITLRNLGASYRALGDAAKALPFYEQANQMAKQLGDRRVEAESAYGLALAQRDAGNLTKAIATVESGLALIEQIRGEIVNPELRVSYFSSVLQYYELYTDLLVARYEKSKNVADVALALETSERSKARSLIELLREARIDIKQAVDPKLVEQAQSLQEKLSLRYRQRTAILARKSVPADSLAKITEEINALTGELETANTKIRRENPRYAELTEGVTVSAKEIQTLLDDQTVLLEYKIGATRSFLWLITKNSVEIHILPARKEIEAKAKQFYDSIVSRDKIKEADTLRLSNDLSQILLAPIAAKIENKRLAIVADGVLQFVPFAALTSPKSKIQNPKFLAEENEIVILPSVGVLAELRRNTNGRSAPQKTIAIFADPIFEANDTRLSSVSKNIKLSEKPSEITRVLRDFNFGETLPRLISSRIEANNIAAFAPKNTADLNIDFDANRENAMGADLSDYRILHFATHGLLDTIHPESSGLMLSLYDENGKPQNGFLSLNQIYNMNLNADLVVLSACQTALGKEVRGEGLIGLTRGFMYAGAKRVVASLWKVDDAATAEFMKRFYQNLLQKNLSSVAALKQTKNEMRQIPRFKSAYFWAGFTLQGDWK